MRVLLIVVAVFSAACASSGFTPHPFPQPAGGSVARRAPAVAGTPESSTGYEVSGTALSLRGAPYRNGGADPRGFDCSGLVWYVFAQHGVTVPRTVTDQFRAGEEIHSPGNLRPGDLVFFRTNEGDASHVGIVIGGDSFVHAPTSSGVVRVEHLSSAYWAPRYVGARRIF